MKELIKTLREQESRNRSTIITANEARQIVEALDKSNWISVEDRLPQNEGEYIVAWQGKNGVIVSTLNFVNGKWRSDVFDRDVNQKLVTHWQPMPEKPEPKKIP